MSGDELARAAQSVLDAADALRDAINGIGHKGRPHDDALAPPRDPRATFAIIGTVGECAACGGAQYGCEDSLNAAYGNLRVALGHERLPWEPVYS